MAGTSTGSSQELLLRLPDRQEGPGCSGHLLLFPGHQYGMGSEVEQQEHKPVPIWDLGMSKVRTLAVWLLHWAPYQILNHSLSSQFLGIRAMDFALPIVYIVTMPPYLQCDFL